MAEIFSPTAEKDLKYFRKKRANDVLLRIADLIDAIKIDPEHGIGNPEPLKHKYVDWWSRKILKEHRLVYKFNDEFLYIGSCRGHYERQKVLKEASQELEQYNLQAPCRIR